MRDIEHDIGTKVVVEVAGTVVAWHKNERGVKYVVAPIDKRIPAVHAHPEIVFPDDGAEVISNVVAFPRAEGEVA